MKKHLQNLRNEQGLTLVELLAVIVILAIIAVVAFVMIGKVIENSKVDTHIANAQQMIASTKLYEATEGGLTVTDEVKLEDLQESGHIEDPIREPWDNGVVDAETSKVVKTGDNEYKVTLLDPSGKGCEIKEQSEEDILTKKREDICTPTP